MVVLGTILTFGNPHEYRGFQGFCMLNDTTKLTQRYDKNDVNLKNKQIQKMKKLILIIVLALLFVSCATQKRQAAFCPNSKNNNTAFYHKHYSFW